MGKVETKERSAIQHKVVPLLWLPIVLSTIFVLLILQSSYPLSIFTKETLAREPCSVIPITSVAANDSSGDAATARGFHPNTSTSVDDSPSEAATVPGSHPNTSMTVDSLGEAPATTVPGSHPNASIAVDDRLGEAAATMVPGSHPNTSIAVDDSLNEAATTVPGSHPNTSIAVDDSLNEAATTVPGSHPDSVIDAATVQGSHQNTSSTVFLDGVVEEVCDMSMGKWMREPRGSIYTNVTCRVLPDIANCQKYGKDPDYQYWRWQPDGCELPRFDPAAFLDLVRGKTMAFVGDSLARNNMESLVCLLSMAETPVDLSEEPSVRILRWHFPSHNFTLMDFWTEYLVDAIDRDVNGTPTGVFDFYLDKMNPRWADKLPGLDYVILSGGNWHFRRNYLHEGGKLIGCVQCADEGVTDLGPFFSIRRVLRAALEYISECKECAGLTTLLRTFTYSHFEDGLWSDGGYCNRTAPLDENQIDMSKDLSWEIRKIQLEEFARITERMRKKPPASPDMKFGIVDVTKAMMMRADGHPGSHWSKIFGNVSDCLHWCMPGPVDMWSDVLFATLRKKSSLY